MKNELIYKYLEGNATPAEEQDVLSWISESEANKAEFCEIRALWSVRDRNSVENDPQRILKSLKALHARIDADASPHRSKRARIIRWAGWSAAAMLGVALVVGGYLVGHDMHKAAMESYYTFTNTGRKPESLRLLDGTQVWLAQGSTLSYGKTFSPHDRTVKLDGEAFFDVASDRDHPFFVKTNTVVVKVVGTSFNVKMYKDTDDTEVVLERGVVKLQFGDNDNMITMQPGQKIYYSSASHDISISEVNVEYLMYIFRGAAPSRCGRALFQRRERVPTFKRQLFPAGHQIISDRESIHVDIRITGNVRQWQNKANAQNAMFWSILRS